MKNSLLAALSCAAVAIPLAAAAASDKPVAPAPPPKVAAVGKPDQVMATVNGKVVTRADFDRALSSVRRGPQGGATPALPPELRARLLDQLVSQEVLYQAAAKVPPKDLGKRVDAELQGLKARFPTPEAFRKELAASGLTEQKLKEMAGRQVTIQNYVLTQIAPKVNVSEADAKKFYDGNRDKMKTPEQVKASHILILVAQGAKPEEKQKALAKAKELQKRAAKGEDFAKLARENSQDPGSKDAGGDLGFFSSDKMVAPFAKAAFALKVGQVSEVVETPFGYHVIKLTARQPAKESTFAEEKEKILGFLKNQAISQAVMKRVEELRKAGKVKVLLPNP
jgi:peptidyl-prolyl cis-trans isomerase C